MNAPTYVVVAPVVVGQPNGATTSRDLIDLSWANLAVMR